jgi:polar amino acid transport system permease protein
MAENKNDSDSAPEPSSVDSEPTLSLQDRLLIVYRSTPWWTVILGVGLMAAMIYMFGNEDRRDIMDFLADRPQLTTDDKFNVTFEINQDAYVLSQTVLAIDRAGDRLTLREADVIERVQEGVLTCREEDGEDCVDQRGTIVTYRDYDVDADSEVADTVREEGLVIDEDDTRIQLETPDGRVFIVNQDTIISREDGVLACNWIVDPDCEALQGDRAVVERPFIIAQAREARRDTEVRFLQDNFVDTVRTQLIAETRATTVECPPSRPEPCDPIDATLATVPVNIVGVETGREDDVVQVRTVDRETLTIDTDRILSRTEALIECDTDADPRCTDFDGTILELAGEQVRGRLTQETDVLYFLQFPDSTEAFRYVRRDIAQETRTPEDCVDTDRDPPCIIELVMEGETVGGRILNENNDEIELELVAEKIVEVPEADIIEVKQRVPGDCALNNPRGCNEGLWLTIIVTFSSYALALAIGLVFGIFRVTGSVVLQNIATAYVEFVRGVPLVVLLVIFAFVIGPELRDAGGVVGDVAQAVFSVLDGFERRVFGTESFLGEAVLGLAVGYGAFVAEVFRAGIQSIPKGQMEASRSLGMSYVESMRHVILPQAVRVVLPPLGNNFIAMLKDTSLIAFLALPDLFQRGRADASSSFQVINVYIGVALYYIIMTLLLSLLVRYVERATRLP